MNERASLQWTGSVGPWARLGHDTRTSVLSLAAGAPAIALALVLLWTGDFRVNLQVTLTLLVVGMWIAFALALRSHVVRPVQLLANLIASLREGDYSLRIRGARTDDDIGLALLEANALADSFRDSRRGAEEASALVERVIETIDVAVFAVDDAGRIRMVNPTGARLLGIGPDEALGKPACDHGLAEFLEGDSPRTVSASFGVHRGPFQLRRQQFRLRGQPHTLVVLTDVARALREQERQAWQRLVRVLGHEINNSLAPIRSLAVSLGRRLARSESSPDSSPDLGRGLEIIASRADALARLMAAYARLAKLPPPRLEPVEISTWLPRIVELVDRTPVQLVAGPALTMRIDSAQLEQVVINLLKNAAEAARSARGEGARLVVRWQLDEQDLRLFIEDNGEGIAKAENLFVPFFTSKPDGTGIGLVLSRQIVEAHGGELSLVDLPSGGCRATVRLPASVVAQGDRGIEGSRTSSRDRTRDASHGDQGGHGGHERRGIEG